MNRYFFGLVMLIFIILVIIFMQTYISAYLETNAIKEKVRLCGSDTVIISKDQKQLFCYDNKSYYNPLKNLSIIDRISISFGGLTK